MVQFTIYKLRRTVSMDDNIPVIQRVDSSLLQPVQTDLIRKFNEHPELFQSQINPSFTQGIKETQRIYDNLPKTNPVVEELKSVKSELQTQTAKMEDILAENAELTDEVQSCKAIITEQSNSIENLKNINANLEKTNSILTEEKKHSTRNTVIWTIVTGIILLTIEHWKDIYDFILSLI